MSAAHIGSYEELMARIREEEPLRHACEVRYVAGLETHAQRAVYLEGDGGVRERRGNDACERLRRDVWNLLKAEGETVDPMQEEMFA